MRRAVDWREVERELDDLPEEFKEQGRFDSLPHVIEILRTLDPSQTLGDLRERHERIESLVDDIVKGYHGGFNKSIHSYSEILRLFTEAQAQNKSIRSSLLALKKQLGSRTTQLRNHWHRSNVLRHTLAILDNVELIAHVPDKVDALCGLPVLQGGVADGFGFGMGGMGGHGDGSDEEVAVDFSSGPKGKGKGASSSSHHHRRGSRGAKGLGAAVGSGALNGQQGAALLSGYSLEDRLQRYEECTSLLRFALGELGGQNSTHFNQVKVLCEMKESVLKREKMVKARILEEISGYLYKKGEEVGEGGAPLGAGLQMAPTRPRTLSVQSPEAKERQETACIERLAVCMIDLGGGASSLTTVVLKECQQRLQRLLVDFWKGSEPAAQFGERASGLKRGQQESKVLSYVSERVHAMCRVLQRVYDRHSELAKAVAANRKPGRDDEEEEKEDGEKHFIGEVWSLMQAECVSLLRVLLGEQERVATVRKLSERLVTRRHRTSVSGAESKVSFTFSNDTSRSKQDSGSKAQDVSSGRNTSAVAKPIFGYRQALGKMEGLFGLYCLRAVYEPMQALSKHCSQHEQKPASNSLMQFLAEHNAKLAAQERL